ncbi:MAG: putative lipoate-protein ligase A [Candidatus Anoxychlamydiales bacterium]|nr:putative lipoate-protein ligase A [Candidatus Anoxychlamydiales bacterium]
MLSLIHTKKLNIFKQLRLEEILLKNYDKPFCLINEGTSSSVILGISNVAQDLVEIEKAKKDNIPILKRFTAGGCVFVDKNTLFVTFIFSKKSLDITFFPEPILRWAESFYKKVFEVDNFKLIENDFVIDDKKIAGNAMYIKKDRFLLHTSFLMDFDDKKMKRYLKIPKIAPKYRKNRSHEKFLSSLREKYSKEDFSLKIKDILNGFFKIKDCNLSDIENRDTKFSTTYL